MQCPGYYTALKANCLSDLLLNNDGKYEYLHLPMLYSRDRVGNWLFLTRAEVEDRVSRVASYLYSKGVRRGDRVGILGHNSVEWLVADFAILRIGAITVPAYFTDPPSSVKYIFEDSGCVLIFAEPGKQIEKLSGLDVPIVPFYGDNVTSLRSISVTYDLLDQDVPMPEKDDLATLIYTSGTTGYPKGVMLTHKNILSDLVAILQVVQAWESDLMLSFLPVSHAFERTAGHFTPVACGTAIAYAEDVTTLTRDIQEIKPTIMVSVPRLYEKIYAGVKAKLSQESVIKQKLFALSQSLGRERFYGLLRGARLSCTKQILWWILDKAVNKKLRDKMGGRLRFFVSGGAKLDTKIADFLLAAGIQVLSGYGLSESSPTLTVNPLARNKPDTVGPPLPGVELKIMDDGELLARGPMIMRGYWKRPNETKEALDSDGWLHTGDLAEFDEDGYVKILGRKKEIIVLSNGENVSPAAVEACLLTDPCVSQAIAIGDSEKFLSAIIVADRQEMANQWKAETKNNLPSDWRSNTEVISWLLLRLNGFMKNLPSYAAVKKIIFADDEWTQENGLLTPTMKLKRGEIVKLYAKKITALYD